MVMESLQRLDPPQTLGKLTLLARLGEGGMAQVYVAAQGAGALARLCAVKLLRPDVADADYRRRFLDEARLVVRLHHNNLVDVREAGEQDGQPYIVMELCEGRDLADLWDRCAEIGKAFPVPLSVYIVREALRGLHYAHGFGGLSLVHRDISPSNLLIDWAGAVRVADFGLATSVLKVTSTMPGLVFGKVGYMAPEQATRAELDARADVYGCGVVLWELITGRPLRDSGMDTNTVARFSAPRPSAFSRRVDPDLDDIIVRALATRPEDRYADAGEFMRALSDWLVGHAPQTDQETLAEFMRTLFPQQQARDHERLGLLLAPLLDAPPGQAPSTGVFHHGDTASKTRDVGAGKPWGAGEEIPRGVVIAERYRVEAALGRGGMGTVYLAEHVTVGRKVAVKVLTHEWSAHETVARRFREEARAASAAGHPNIVEVFDAGTLPDGRLYLVMEHLVGRSLYDELQAQRTLPPARAVAIMRDVARGVAAAHDVGIIHRDLKPDNVMLVRRGDGETVKVLDFGISASAERVAEQQRLTQPGHALGTPEYMAPEQAKGRAPTERVDIYAIVAMLFELLAGQPPFVSENFVEVLARKATEPAPALDAVRPGLPPGLVALVRDCLAIDPAARPRDARELIARLDHALEGGALVPVGATAGAVARPPQVVRMPASPPRPPQPPASRPLWPWLAGGMTLAAIVLVVVRLALGPARRPAARSTPARPRRRTWCRCPRRPWSCRSRSAPPRSSPKPAAPARATTAARRASPRRATMAARRQAHATRRRRPAEQAGHGRRRRPAEQAGHGDDGGPPSKPDTGDDGGPPSKPDGTSKLPSTLESESCRETRRAAGEAASTGQWSAVLAHANTRGCWGGSYRAEGVRLRVEALFQLERFDECARAGANASGEAKTMADACARRAG
ncbi:MAG: serine/threonine-protein kinase [Nannocystaceae bacterium]